MDQSPASQASLLEELDAQQNEVIAKLEQLNSDIESVIRSLAPAKHELEEAA